MSIHITIPNDSWSPAQFLQREALTDRQVTAASAAIYSAVLAVPRNGWQVGKCNGTTATIRGRRIIVTVGK